MQKQHRVLWWVGLLVALSWVSLAFLNPDPPGPDTSVTTMTVGYFLGSLFAHATLAAALTVFGPGRFIWRGPLSLGWASTLPVVLAINDGIHGSLGDYFVVMIGACLFGQWLLLQIPLWLLALGFRLVLRPIDAVDPSDSGQLRFGIRHLLIVMFITSLVLGIGRIIVPKISPDGREIGSVFAFFTLAAIVVTLPLLLAALMRRKAILGVLLSLLLLGVATAIEAPLIQSILMVGPAPRTEDFIAINVVSALMILVVAGVMRLNGYRLYSRPVPNTP